MASVHVWYSSAARFWVGMTFRRHSSIHYGWQVIINQDIGVDPSLCKLVILYVYAYTGSWQEMFLLLVSQSEVHQEADLPRAGCTHRLLCTGHISHTAVSICVLATARVVGL